MGRIAGLCGALALLAVCPPRLNAAEPIRCAFGYCLGEKWDGKFTAHTDAVYTVTPPTPNPAFKRYTLRIVPSTGQIAEIIASSEAPCAESTGGDRRFWDFRMILQEKYGAGLSGRTGYFELGDAARTILLTCDAVLSIAYTDRALAKRELEERPRPPAASPKRGL